MSEIEVRITSEVKSKFWLFIYVYIGCKFKSDKIRDWMFDKAVKVEVD